MKYYSIIITSFKNKKILSSSMPGPFSKLPLHVNVPSKKSMFPFCNLLKLFLTTSVSNRESCDESTGFIYLRVFTQDMNISNIFTK